MEWESYEWDNTALNHVEARFKNNKDVVLAAVRKNGYALQYASLAFQNDKDVVLAAVSQNGFALRYASAALKNDIDVVSTAVRSRGERALEDASEALQAEFKLKKIVEVHVDNGVNSSRRWTRKYTIEDLQAESKQTVAPPDSPDVSNQNGLGPK